MVYLIKKIKIKLSNKYLFNQEKKMGFVYSMLLFLIDIITSLFKKLKKDIPTQVQKILIIKPDHIGDVIIGSALIPILKKEYPEATVDIVCGSWANGILENNKNISTLYNIDHFILNRKNLKKLEKIKQFIKQYFNVLEKIRKVNYDLCIVARPSIGNLITLAIMSKSNYLSGYNTAGFGKMLNFSIGYDEKVHDVMNHLKLLDFLSLKTKNAKYDIACNLVDLKEAKKYFINTSKIKLLLNIQAGIKEKSISNIMAKTLILKILKRFDDVEITLTFSQSNYFEVQSLVDDIRNERVKISYETSTLSKLIALISEVDLIITPDTSIIHIGSALNKKLIGIYRNNERFYKRFSPFNTKFEIIFSENSDNIYHFNIKQVLDKMESILKN